MSTTVTFALSWFCSIHSVLGNFHHCSPILTSHDNDIVTNPPDFSGSTRYLVSNPWFLILALKILRNVPLQSSSLIFYSDDIVLLKVCIWPWISLHAYVCMPLKWWTWLFIIIRIAFLIMILLNQIVYIPLYLYSNTVWHILWSWVYMYLYSSTAAAAHSDTGCGFGL